MALCLVLSATACVGLPDAPSPAPRQTTPDLSPAASPGRPAGALVVAVPADPSSFLPPASDETAQLVGDLLYDPLYRLDSSLTPQPALAATLPAVSADGLTWTIDLRGGARFHTGAAVTATDAALSLALATSSSCPFERELCERAAAHVTALEAVGEAQLRITLRSPWAPLLAEVLGRVPIISAGALQAAVASIVERAAALDAAALGSRVAEITAQTNAERCLVTTPPSGCLLSDYARELTALLAPTGAAVPSPERFARADGSLDTEAHGAALLTAASSLVRMLGVEGTDRLAAGAPLVDVTREPLGGGPFRLADYAPGERLTLVRHPGHVPEPSSLDSVVLQVVRDPSVATTALLGADIDWVLAPDVVAQAGLASVDGVVAAQRPESVVRSILFNTRPGRPFELPEVRLAFALCLDRDSIAADIAGPGAVARAETASGSWALGSAPEPVATDRLEARRLLDAAGWLVGGDGIRSREAQRLSSEVSVRPGRADLIAFGAAAAEQLRSCGIEFAVVERDGAADLLLRQLGWPNEFETVLVTRALAADPDTDLSAFESVRATSAENPVDENPGAFSSSAVDELLARARSSTAQAERADAYGEVVRLLGQDPPSIPLWYESAYGAVSTRITNREGEQIDPAEPRYWWDAWSWKLGATIAP